MCPSLHYLMNALPQLMRPRYDIGLWLYISLSLRGCTAAFLCWQNGFDERSRVCSNPVELCTLPTSLDMWILTSAVENFGITVIFSL